MNIFQQYQTIALQLTAHGLHTSTTWPYVRLPYFEAQASAAKEITAAAFVLIAPVVEKNQVKQYEEFVASNQDWIQESLEYRGLATNVSSLRLPPRVFPLPRASFDKTKSLPFHLPVGQISSVHLLSSQVNGDVGTDTNIDVAYALMNETRNSVMSGFIPSSNNSGSLMSETRNAVMSSFRSTNNTGSLMNETNNAALSGYPATTKNPGSFLATPVFGSFADDSPIVAIFSGYLRWYRNFENLLPIDSKPLILVVRNCNDSLSYEVRGPHVEFLGFGDTFHDPKYDHLERNGTFTPYGSSTGCDFTLHIYPTLAFEVNYHTNAPTVNTVAIVSCFFLTAFLFVLFNVVVEYRQKRIVSNATKNSALVSSLFPENVRNRIIEEYNGGCSSLQQRGSDPAFPARHVLTTKPPIADRFENCSVCFADLVGCKCPPAFRLD